jgi:hypothetical protein
MKLKGLKFFHVTVRESNLYGMQLINRIGDTDIWILVKKQILDYITHNNNAIITTVHKTVELLK